jgi:phosphohistidine phosphatase
VDLYLVRHGISWERDDDRWPGDRERPLTDEGVARFREAVTGLARIMPKAPSLVLSSPLVRTWQTALVLSEVAGWPAPEASEGLEPDADPAVLLKGSEFTEPDRGASGAMPDSIALVGHEPGLGEIASFLLSGDIGDDIVRMKKGGVAKISFLTGSPEPASGILRWSLTPRVLRTLGEGEDAEA